MAVRALPDSSTFLFSEVVRLRSEIEVPAETPERKAFAVVSKSISELEVEVDSRGVMLDEDEDDDEEEKSLSEYGPSRVALPLLRVFDSALLGSPVVVLVPGFSPAHVFRSNRSSRRS